MSRREEVVSNTPAENIELQKKGEQQQKCVNRPKPSAWGSGIPCCGHLHDKYWFKLLGFFLMLSVGVLDLVSDWWLYADVSMTEKGLVYGPPEDLLRYLLLTFSIIGSLTIIFEIINLWWEIFRDDPRFDGDLLSAVTVWIEDVPQIAISVVIFKCREEAISYFQLVKASVIIVKSIIILNISFIRYFSKKAIHDVHCAMVNAESCRHVAYRVFTILGLILTLVGAIVIFLMHKFERSPDGSLHFKVPKSFVQGEYDDQKFFRNVSIYFSHELFDWDNTSAENLNLVRLLRMNDIRREKVARVIKIQYDRNTGPSKIVIWERDISGTMQAKECFRLDRNNKKVTIGSSCASYLPATANKFVIKFHYVKQSSGFLSAPRLIFGDIKYNIKVKYSRCAKCEPPDFVINGDVNDHSANSKVAALHYYRVAGNCVETYHVIHTSITEGTFYHASDLEDITDVWKTGFAHCKSSGSLTPHRDDSIDVSCN